jgi:hypothetical protein
MCVLFTSLAGSEEPSEVQQPISYQALLPIEIMLSALSLRFRFHFEGSRPTNRLDKVMYNSHAYAHPKQICEPFS